MWRLCPGVTDPANPWMVDLAQVFGGNDRAAYLKTRVFSPDRREAVLSIGSDDGVKAWLNGEEVHAENASRPLERDQDAVDVVLEEGWNDLLLKITQGSGGWSVCARFLSPRGASMPDLRPAAQ